MKLQAYGLTSVYRQPSGAEVELKQIIPASVYYALSHLADPRCRKLVQKRSYFLWQKQSFTVTEYISPLPSLEDGRVRLSCQSSGEPIIPPFIHVQHKVTGDMATRLSSFNMSLYDKSDLDDDREYANPDGLKRLETISAKEF